jgi:predicted lipoprotein with Yx(FWY)xxD motif
MRSIVFALVLGLSASASWASFADEAVPSAVVIQSTGAGRYLTDTAGKTLYTYTRDTVAGESACTAQCAKEWPPLEAPADAVSSRDWSVVTRSDGTKQWAHKGKPLYRYAKDTGPWSMVGAGLANSWYVAFELITTPTEITVHESLLGRVLADIAGMTLYTHAGDKAGKARCTDKCLRDWQPLWAPAIATSRGDWSAAVRDDGKKQWAYKGQPLYAYRSELKPGETVADGLDGVWHAAVVEPPPPVPSWVTIQKSDLGPVLADAKGHTLYTVPNAGNWNFETMRTTTCGEDCLATYWHPVLLGANEPALQGNWSTIAREDGSKQLSYRGYGVYTFANDKKPGDVLRGQNYGSGIVSQSMGFRAILQSSTMRLYP